MEYKQIERMEYKQIERMEYKQQGLSSTSECGHTSPNVNWIILNIKKSVSWRSQLRNNFQANSILGCDAPIEEAVLKIPKPKQRR